MPRSITKPADAADPADIVHLREAAGWSQDELAAVLGVLPRHVAAWESGSTRLTRYDADVLRWLAATALHETKLGLLSSECAWTLRNRYRLEQYLGAGGDHAYRARRALAAHRQRCEACRAAGGLIPGAESALLPPPPGPFGVARRWPWWTRVPVRAALAGVAGGTLIGLIHLVDLLRVGAQAGPFPAAGALVAAALAAWATVEFHLLRPLGDRAPFLAGQMCAALTLVPAAVAWSALWDRVMTPGMWIFVALFSIVIGVGAGGLYEGDGEFD